MQKRTPTIRQQQAINNLVANGSSMAAAMRKAGYSSKTARAPSKVFQSSGLKPLLVGVIASLEAEREAIFDRMRKTRDKANYRDLIHALDVVTNKHQLLTGGKTEDFGIEEHIKSLNNLILKIKTNKQGSL